MSVGEHDVQRWSHSRWLAEPRRDQRAAIARRAAVVAERRAARTCLVGAAGGGGSWPRAADQELLAGFRQAGQHGGPWQADRAGNQLDRTGAGAPVGEGDLAVAAGLDEPR